MGRMKAKSPRQKAINLRGAAGMPSCHNSNITEPSAGAVAMACDDATFAPRSMNVAARLP